MSNTDMPSEQDIREALDIARKLIKAGVPVFAARPVDGAPGQYHLPRHWEKTIPSEVWLDPSTPNGYRPGWALAAVGGHACDFLDVDPRNGGENSMRELLAADQSPQHFGIQHTPSHGRHYIVASTGQRKAGGDRGLMPGLDLQAGDENGTGRGFVWIAPTVRPSKDPADEGALRAYRWEVPPDLDALSANAEAARASMQPIVDRIAARRSAPRDRGESAPPRGPVDAHALDDPFLDASMAGGTGHGDRSFTLAEAQDFVRPCLIELQQAQIGSIEETANVAAATLSHFVPAFWSADECMGLLEAALAHTAYDPNGPSPWTVEKFRPVLDGRRPPIDAWRAERRAEPPAPPEVVVEAEPGEEALSTLEKLRRRVVSMGELSRRPPPEPLVQGLLNRNTEAWIIGAPGSLKSFIALDIAAHVATGQAWQGRRVEKGPVLYLAAEGETGMTLRAAAWIRWHQGLEPDVHVLPYPVQVKSNDGQWDALVQIARELQPVLIILDTQHRVSAGLEENSATDMGLVVSAIGKLRRATGACVLTVHHTGRNGKDARGSSAIDGAQDTELKVIRPDNEEGRRSLVCKIVQDKQKDMAEGDPGGLHLQLQIVDLGEDERGERLSSLVVSGAYDPFAAGEGFTAEDAAPWRRPDRTIVQPWTRMDDLWHHNATLPRRILQVLEDHTPGNDGLTEAGIYRILVSRWPEEKHGRGKFDEWMQKVKSVLPDLVVKVAGQRWGIDEVELTRIKAAQGE